MTTQQLQYFLKLAEELNFTDVANYFYITQPTLSRQIMSLENELGFSLFIREKNGIRLSAEGAALYHGLLPMAEQFRLLVDGIKKSYESKFNTISIGIMDEQLISSPLLLAINQLHHDYPELNFKFSRKPHFELWQGISDGTFDIINCLWYPQDSYSSHMEFIALEKEHIYLAIEKHLEPELSGSINHRQLISLLRKYPLFLPSIHAPESFDPIKELLNNLNLPELPKGVDIRIEGAPLSIPMQVIAGLGIAVSNKSNLFSVDPSIKIMEISDSSDYIKGIYYNTTSASPYLTKLIQRIKDRMLA